VFRDAGFRRNAGKMAHRLCGEVRSAGGHARSARGEIPLDKIDCGSINGNNRRRYVPRQIRKMPTMFDIAGFFISHRGNPRIFGVRGVHCRFLEGFGFRSDRVEETTAGLGVAPDGGVNISTAVANRCSFQ
jgi:hypothetical protein